MQNTTSGQLLNVDTSNNNITLNGLNSAQLNTWNSTSSMPVTRDVAATVTANGYVYVIDGLDASNTVYSTVYYARLNADGSIPASGTGSWTTTIPTPTALRSAMGTYANGYIYIMGGKDSAGNAQDTVYSAKVNPDGTLGTWHTLSNNLDSCGYTGTTNNQVYDGAAISADGYLYMVGGRDDPNAQGVVCYAKTNSDGTTSAWATTTALNTNVQQAAVAVANGYMYVIGGWGGSNTGQNIVQYAPLNSDGTVGSWTTSGNTLATDLCGEAATVANGYLYAIGGYSDTNCSTSATSTIEYAQLNAN
ncbi:MAG: hypothetical protein ACREHG_07545, partial [Candidatus Saccharimonadales bacterium]